MAQKIDLAQQLDAQAVQATTLAEAQALHARADRIRRRGGAAGWITLPFYRN